MKLVLHYTLAITMSLLLATTPILATTPTPSVSPESSPTPEPSVSPTVSPSITPSPSPEPALEITNTYVNSSHAYEWDIIEGGDRIYTDRSYNFTNDIDLLKGAHYLKTANNDKHSYGSPHIEFTVNKPVTVLVLYDSRIDKPKDWILDWTDTFFHVFIYNADHKVYMKDYLPGVISLGANVFDGYDDKDTSMYSVIVIDTEEHILPVITPTAAPVPTKVPETGTLAPEGKAIGPDFPQCTVEEVGTFGTYSLGYNHSQLEDEIVVTVELPTDFTPRPGILKVLQGEGHNWNKGYATVTGPLSDLPTSLPYDATQFQDEEIIIFSWGQDESALTEIGAFEDSSPGSGSLATDKDNLTTEYEYVIPELQPGTNVLKLDHKTPSDSDSNSVYVKGTICSEPAPTKVPAITATTTPTPEPSPTNTPAPTETPEPSPTITPSITPTPTPEPYRWGYELIGATQGLHKNWLPIAPFRSIASNALYEADGLFFSLGRNGQLTMKFECKVEDISGPDFAVYEMSYDRDYEDELAQVEVSEDGAVWYPVLPFANNKGPVSPLGRTVIDFSTTPLSTIQYVRFKDVTDYDIFTDFDADGYDVDAMEGFSLICD
ncbi:MAG: hypothetical protein ACOCXQ_00615 [Patescibacteria group bacterium]